MKKILPLLVLFFTINIFSQKEANFWYFGENAGLDFSTNPPTALTNGQLNTTEGCSSFSSPSGELLFYSDGIKVFSKNHTLMTYSDGSLANNLQGNPSSTQSGMIIPKPGSTAIYYLFTVGTDFVPNGINPNPGFNYYTIDMSKNNSLGEIIDGPVNLAKDPVTNTDNSSGWSEKVTAVKGNDCNVYWVLSFVNDTFYSYKITENGVDVSNVVTSKVNFTASDKRGYLQVSPNGKKIAFADYNASNSNNINGSLVLFDFDNISGKINQSSSQVLIPMFSGEAPYGVAFSQQSNKLYVSSYSGSFKIFQFDIENSDVASSKTEIINKFGFRGALQLGPNGKIYVSIPGSNFLDVIENPNKSGDDIIYTKDAINLNTGRTTQGLPPFLASLLLPIEIKDEDTNTVVNNQDLQFCIGQDKVITPASISGINLLYTWTFNDGTTETTISSSATESSLKFTDIDTTDIGIYNLTITLEDDCGNNIEYNATFNVAVFAAATATKPDDIIFCDLDRDGFNSFDLQDDTPGKLKDIILTGLDVSKFDVLYFLNIDDASSGDDANDLPNPYTNTTAFSSETIYARVQNKSAPNACFDITEFKLAITGLPIPVQPEPYRTCDDLESSNDTDGIINTFLLNTKDAEILGALEATQYNVSYHTTQNGAEINDVATIITKDSNHSVTNSQTVFIRVENKDNFGCYDAGKTLDLIVDPLPVIKSNPAELDQCVSVNNTNPTVNLTTAEINISETADVTFEYFEDAAGLNKITDITSYPVKVNTPQSVYVIVTSNQDCVRDIVELKLNVAQTNDNDYNDTQTPVCDDFLDTDGNNTPGSNDDTDNITNFYLDKAAIVTKINPPTNTEVFFFENFDDRNNSLNEIDITNYRNDITKIDINTIPEGIKFPIYYKIISTINNNCQGLGQFYLQINSVPIANPVSDLELCDNANDGNGTNGIVQNFNLENQTNTISADFSVTYHDSAANANSGNNALTSPYENTVKDSQTIYVRVTNTTTNCFTDHTTFNLVVNPIPIANFVQDLEICDDNSDGSARNGFSQSFDLESQSDAILGTQNKSLFTVTYHRDLNDAQNGISPLVSPFSNTKPDIQTIYVRVYNSNTTCANGISQFDVIVNSEPLFEPISNLSYCDDDLDDDDTNGIIQNIDLEGQIPSILGTTQDPDDFKVTFHENQDDAISGNTPLLSPYTNTNPTETIFVRIQNKATSCVNDDATFDVIVNPLPNFTVTTPQVICLNNLPLNISVENPSDIYTYQWKDLSGNIISTSDNVDITNGGNYTVTATTTNGTNCTKLETIVVDESNPATLNERFITIIDESNNIGSTNTISISIATTNNNLGLGDYQFAVRNDDNNERIPFIGFQKAPLFENLEGGIYTIIVNDKKGCSPDAELQISVIQFPKFFTPNGDGKNDTWVIKGANKTFYPNSSINIFNRFGKLMAQVPIDSQGWNGTFNGKTLPSDDYWFNIQLIPADTSKYPILKKGHFSLLRK
ncbi:hypothetical protein BTO04_14845 [Polaribacter sp. SA4-10]|uniref:T9SS type B sorting domain-containing protein n=1 Tax=Polaribacter sp. SA4-10 TaxID=754397 RepID=UPI000B3C25FC|nr:T9SS type B sorting domain-containing protein [Polaribacter sp. SA4-10]ARV07893.1 hypothetical protein BTO04_14845 [Polaribacter sp. SA4-10]